MKSNKYLKKNIAQYYDGKKSIVGKNVYYEFKIAFNWKNYYGINIYKRNQQQNC